MAYEAHRNGEPGVQGGYGKIGWNTWLRLLNYKYQKKDHPLVEEHQMALACKYDWNNYYIRITPFGIQYYGQEYDRYLNLYPAICAPRPTV